MNSTVFAILKKVPLKTELSAISDLTQSVDDVGDWIYSSGDVGKLESLMDEINNFKDLLAELKTIGANLNDTLSQWEGWTSELGDNKDRINTAMNDYATKADELGIDPYQESYFDQAQKTIDRIDELSLMFDRAYQDAPLDALRGYL